MLLKKNDKIININCINYNNNIAMASNYKKKKIYVASEKVFFKAYGDNICKKNYRSYVWSAALLEYPSAIPNNSSIPYYVLINSNPFVYFELKDIIIKQTDDASFKDCSFSWEITSHQPTFY